jgi:hypothetical protein
MDVSQGFPGLVDDPGQFAVGGPGGFQLVCAFTELDFQVEYLLFEVEDAGLEAVDVGGRADPRPLPDLLAQVGAEAVLQYPDLVCQPPAAVVRGKEVSRLGAVPPPGGGCVAEAWTWASRSGCR